MTLFLSLFGHQVRFMEICMDAKLRRGGLVMANSMHQVD